MFYSKTAGGFYSREIHGDNIPEDAVEITMEQHQALLAGQSSGKIITADAKGNPVLTDPPAPTAEQVKATRTAEIKAALVELDFKSIRPLREGDAERVASFKAQAEALRKELAGL